MTQSNLNKWRGATPPSGMVLFLAHPPITWQSNSHNIKISQISDIPTFSLLEKIWKQKRFIMAQIWRTMIQFVLCKSNELSVANKAFTRIRNPLLGFSNAPLTKKKSFQRNYAPSLTKWECTEILFLFWQDVWMSFFWAWTGNYSGRKKLKPCSTFRCFLPLLLNWPSLHLYIIVTQIFRFEH